MTKEIENFSKVADLAVERVKLKNVESSKFCETKTVNRYREKKMAYAPFKTWFCVKTMFERRRRSTSETMLVDEIKRKKQKEESEL